MSLKHVSESLAIAGVEHKLVIAVAVASDVKRIRVLSIQQHNPIYIKLKSQLKRAGLSQDNRRVNYDAASEQTRSSFEAWPDMGVLSIQTGPAVFQVKINVSSSGDRYTITLGARDLSGAKSAPWVQTKKEVPGSKFKYDSFEEVLARNWKRWFKQAQALLK